MAGIFGGGDAGKSEMEKANKLMQDNIARLEAIGIPSIEAQKIALQTPELVGQLEAEVLGSSAMQGVQEDPRLKAAQMSALEDISNIAKSGGLDATAKLNLEQGLGRVAGAEQARLQTLREDPTLGQGQKLALQIQAIQGAGQSQKDIALQTAAQAQQARMAALGQQGSMATQMSQQQLALAGQKASAADVINQFNTQGRQGVNQFNAQNRIATQRGVENTRNQQEMYNKGLFQQEFQNKMAKVGGITGQQTNLANQYTQQATAAQQAQQAQTNALLNLAGTVGGAAVGGPAGAAVGSKLASAAAPAPTNTNYAVNWQPGKDPYGNIS